MSDNEIAYDIRLETLYENVKLKIWINEELQLQSEEQKEMILKSLSGQNLEHLCL
ncbi:MAG: hypothetical protein ACOC44_18690 [Promethearchaeia archaeon]